MYIAFIDSWIQNVAEGSGTAAGIGGLRHALIARETLDRGQARVVVRLEQYRSEPRALGSDGRPNRLQP